MVDCTAYQRRAYIVYVELCTGVMDSRMPRTNRQSGLPASTTLVTIGITVPREPDYINRKHSDNTVPLGYSTCVLPVNSSMLYIYFYVLNLQNMFSKVIFILKMIYNVSQNENRTFSAL